MSDLAIVAIDSYPKVNKKKWGDVVKPERRKLFKKAAKATMNNAEDLFEESLLLFENKFYPRAFSLGILTCEEMAKAFIYQCVYHEILREDEIQKLVLEHEEKILRSGHLMAIAVLLSEHDDEIEKAVEHDKGKHDHKDHKLLKVLNKWGPKSAGVAVDRLFKAQSLKLDSLYVHVRENKIIEPKDIVDKKKCDDLFTTIARTMSMTNAMLDHDEFFPKMVTQFFGSTIKGIKEYARKQKEKKKNWGDVVDEILPINKKKIIP